MFHDALDLVLKLEGGYANDPNDPGGATNYGITQSVYDPSGDRNIKDITPSEVGKIYYENYWLEGKCDKINEISQAIADIHFDCCVNCGVGTAAKLLQEILGVTIDGIIGVITLSRINDSSSLILQYLMRRKIYYDRLVAQKPKLHVFLDSWYHRLNTLAKQFHIDFVAKP